MKLKEFEKKFFDCEIEKLIWYEFNNKIHPKEQIDMIINSVTECWFLNPIIIDENFMILAWHWRLEAMKKLKVEMAPVIQYFWLTTIQKQKFRILDNRIADFSEYDLKNLEIELKQIWDEALNKLYETLNIPGIDKIEFDEDKDDVVPQNDEADIIVEIWDIFQLWNHRLICWDATNYDHVAKLMQDQKADMIFTDPPYNVNYKWNWKKTSNWIKNDNLTKDKFNEFLEKVFENYKKIVKDTAWIYIFHSSTTQSQFENFIIQNWFEIKNQLIRNKPMSWLGFGNYRPKHEPFFYCCVKWKSPNFYWDRTHSTVIDIFEAKTDKEIIKIFKKAKEREKQWKTTIRSMSRENVNDYVHPTQKPIELITYAIENSSKKNEIIVDFFGWSWSTLIACEKTNRSCLTMELDPKYIQTIIQRYGFYTENKKEIKCINRDLDLNKIIND